MIFADEVENMTVLEIADLKRKILKYLKKKHPEYSELQCESIARDAMFSGRHVGVTYVDVCNKRYGKDEIKTKIENYLISQGIDPSKAKSRSNTYSTSYQYLIEAI